MRVPLIQIQQTPARMDIHTSMGQVQVQGHVGKGGAVVTPAARPNSESIKPSGIVVNGSGDIQFSSTPAQVSFQVTQKPSVTFSVSGGNFDLLAG